MTSEQIDLIDRGELAVQLGDWGERQASAKITETNGKSFRNADMFDDSADRYLLAAASPKLSAAGLRDGPIQIKTKSTSTFRRYPWQCNIKGHRGQPREEHGIEYWRFLRYVKRGVHALLFVELKREVSRKRFENSEQVLVCIPRLCNGRVGPWRDHNGRVDNFIFFDRGLMPSLGSIATAKQLLRFK